MSPGWHLCLWFEYPQSPAQYRPGPAALCRPNRCASLSSMHHLTAPPIGRAGGWGGGLWFTSASVQPTMETLSKTNICLAKVKVLEPSARLSVCLSVYPAVDFFFYFMARLDRTFYKTRADLIFSCLLLATLPHMSQPFGLWWPRLEKKHHEVNQPAAAQHLDRKSKLSSHSLDRKHFKPG